MQKGKIVLGFIGLLLATAGIVLFNFGQPATKTAAQTGYTSSWQATELYRLTMTNNTGGTQSLGAIGVSKWDVSGTIGTTSFSEVWTGPAANSVVVSTNTNNECNSNGYDKTKWLATCTNFIGNDEGTNTFRLLTAAPSSIFSEGKIGTTTPLSWSGGGSFCATGTPLPPSGCVLTSGTYGFGYYGSESLKVAGLMMPLHWNVTGTINP